MPISFTACHPLPLMYMVLHRNGADFGLHAQCVNVYPAVCCMRTSVLCGTSGDQPSDSGGLLTHWQKASRP